MSTQNNELMLDVGQANELKLAFRREGFSNEDIKALCERKGVLGQVRSVLLGHAEIKMIEHLVDLDKTPFIPDGWSIAPDSEQLPNRIRGKVKFDQSKIALHLDDSQKSGKVAEGNKLKKKLEKMPVYGAQQLDFYLANPHLIPEDWKGKVIFFWGTIYRSARGDLYVRYLCWSGDRWNWNYYWLGHGWDVRNPAAVSAS